ncbi:ABC transporter substrate-binding protein [Leifsonia sp. NPDC014704]|uniref:ABC transporter substrate-binding protein n=1 Tax=Leifsonia sp. NPDC014704 TaxID=3364123 RepID=UPI0036F473FF
MSTSTLNRRGFLALTGAAGIGIGLGLAGCTPAGSSSGSLSGTSLAILPSTAPSSWNTVLAQANKQLQKDHGFTLNTQFINWQNYGQQALLKFTAGAKFDTALQALWLNMAQLQQSHSLADLTNEIDKWPNLKKQLSSQLIESNKWSGKLWGIPQVNSAARLQHFSIRKDLADKLGFSDIQDYDTLEKYFYDVKQKEVGVTPFGVASNQTFELVLGTPSGLFNQHSWQNPTEAYVAQFAGSGLWFVFDEKAAEEGKVKLVPLWEDEGVLGAFKKIRQYYQDGIINADGLNAENATIQAQFTAGKYAGQWAITDGTASNALVALKKAVPTAELAEVLPYGGDITSVKPLQTFQADNLVVVNANGGNVERALALQDWLSIEKNHDLIEYGIEGKDWEATSDGGIKQLSDYSFPGYALLWRSSLERKSSFMTESEKKVFAWAQDYGNFTKSAYASFIPDVTPVKQAAAQMNNVITQYANPLYYGVTDVDSQLDKLKKAADSAGLSQLQAEMEKQANAYLKAQKK